MCGPRIYAPGAAETYGGVSNNWLGPTDGKRAYVLSKETKEKIAANKIRTELACKVRPQGTAYVGSRAIANAKLTQWVKEPLLKCSYITTACMASASSGTTRVAGADLHNNFALGRFEEIAAWLRSEDEFSNTDTVKQVVKVDVTRVLREMYPLRRIKNACFKVVQSTRMRAVLGQDILQQLEKQDDDSPDPMQSDIEYDEEEEVRNYLEASLDRGILAGLAIKYVHKYRDLIMKEYFRVFRLRLGKDAPAHFEPMSVKTIPGTKLRKGYSINLSNLTK